MLVGRNMHNGISARRRAETFTATLTGALGLLVIGYPLAPATIGTMLLGYLPIVAGAAQFVLGHRFKMTRSAESIMAVPVRSADYMRYR
jgi:hypothetical protein